MTCTNYKLKEKNNQIYHAQFAKLGIFYLLAMNAHEREILSKNGINFSNAWEGGEENR
jgi:hypothetical protein